MTCYLLSLSGMLIEVCATCQGTPASACYAAKLQKRNTLPNTHLDPSSTIMTIVQRTMKIHYIAPWKQLVYSLGGGVFRNVPNEVPVVQTTQQQGLRWGLRSKLN